MMKRYLDSFWELPQEQGYYLVEILTQKGVIVRIKNSNAILKHPVKNLFRIEHTYHDTNQTDKTREQKLKWEPAVIGEVKRRYEC